MENKAHHRALNKGVIIIPNVVIMTAVVRAGSFWVWKLRLLFVLRENLSRGNFSYDSFNFTTSFFFFYDVDRKFCSAVFSPVLQLQLWFNPENITVWNMQISVRCYQVEVIKCRPPTNINISRLNSLLLCFMYRVTFCTLNCFSKDALMKREKSNNKRYRTMNHIT